MAGHGGEIVTVSGGGTSLTTQNSAAMLNNLNLTIGVNVQAYNTELNNIANLDATVGILVKTAANSYSRRVLTGTVNEITVTNGNGGVGNMTVSLPNALTFTGKTITGGTHNNTSITNSTFQGTTGNFSGPLTVNNQVDISGSAGGQIKFPATQNASSDANTLDDYEEGTFTVTDQSGAGLSITTSTASYVKVGQFMHCILDITFPATASGANVTLGALPYTTASTSGNGDCSGSWGYNGSGTECYAIHVGSGSTSWQFLTGTTGGGLATNANFTGALFRFALYARTAA